MNARAKASVADNGGARSGMASFARIAWIRFPSARSRKAHDHEVRVNT
jgi:hypothetical protein